MKFLRVLRGKNRRFFLAWPFFLVLHTIVYQSALIPIKISCLKISGLRTCHISFFYNIFDQYLFCCYEKLAICKSRHWNIGIGIGFGNGIGIGTDITNAIISSSIRPMNPKLSRVVT